MRSGERAGESRLVADEKEIFVGRLDRLSEASQRVVAASIIDSNQLAQTPDGLTRAFRGGRLYVRYWLARRVLIAATGYKKPNPATRHAILTAWARRQAEDRASLLGPRDVCRRLLRNVAAGRVIEKGWTVNCGEREPFHRLNERVLTELSSLGYGAWQVFTLVVDTNTAGRRFTERTGFVPLLRVPSPFSPHHLILHGLGPRDGADPPAGEGA